LKKNPKSKSGLSSGHKKQTSSTKHTPLISSANSGIRLNRYIANAGICSRREADKLIVEGLVEVNGKAVNTLGTRIQHSDVVTYKGKRISREKSVYVLLNKPKGFITTVKDPKERRTVMQLVAKACEERIYPVGRLDRDTTGLLLFTNDGELARRLSHPSSNIRKLYQVTLDKPLNKNDLEAIHQGLELDDGKAMVDDVAIVSEDKKTVGIQLHIGRNRIVRRIFESLDYRVQKLDRVTYASLTKKDLPRGKWRYLSEKEILRLKHFKK
jgi:23S rRNA pseudouridine2605 synthase